MSEIKKGEEDTSTINRYKIKTKSSQKIKYEEKKVRVKPRASLCTVVTLIIEEEVSPSHLARLTNKYTAN